MAVAMLPDVQQKTIRPVIESRVAAGTQVGNAGVASVMMTDEYDIYARLVKWGYAHQSVCHGKGEYAKDADNDGVCEVPVNTLEGFWSLLRSWLRPHRGVSQEHLPLYLGFFEFVHNARRRGKALLGALMAVLLT